VIVRTPVASPIPKIATINAASKSVGIVRIKLRKNLNINNPILFFVTTFEAKKLKGTAKRNPSIVPKKEISNVLIKGVIILGKNEKSGGK
ncbi:hypothetical protein, partial [Salmonella enterica]|uniref:hypothetical protein n=1 Tax=Salmonella enterica TaxID=28901 RepID=UPI0039E88071